MPTYRLRYTVETCLQHANDLTFAYRDYVITVLFSRKTPEQKDVFVETIVDQPRAWEAQKIASTFIIPPILDALSFAAGTPLLLGDCVLTLKDEVGSRVRRAIYIGQRRAPNAVTFQGRQIEETNRMLGSDDAPKLPLRWLRYSQHRTWTLDRFVFAWLALEELAGDTDIATPCPHCGTQVKHRGADRIRTYELLHACNPTLAEQEFNTRIWGRARNSVFHGSREPDPAFLGELSELSTLVRNACEKELCRAYGLEDAARNPLPVELVYRVLLFVEWQTETPEARLAEDWPATELQALVDGAQPGTAGELRPESRFTLLPMQQADQW